MRQPGIILVLLFALLTGRTFAQTDTARRWTLDECIAYAQAHNIEIKTQRIAAQDKTLTLSESKWNYAPNVSFSSGYNLSTGRVLDPTTYEFIENQTVQGTNSSLSAGITLLNGLKNLHTLQRARLDLQSALLSVEKTRNDVMLNVTARYLEILAAGENIRNAEQLVSALTVQEQKTARKVEARKVTTADLLQIQSQRADAENELLTARNQLSIAKLNLCQLLEIEDYASFETVAPQDTDIARIALPRPPDRGREAVQWLPELRMAHLGIDIARRDLQIARADYYPSVSLSAGYGTSYSDARQKMFQNPDGTYRYEAYPFFHQYRDNASMYVSLSLNVPIFNRLTTRKSVQRRKLAIRQAEYALLTAEKQVAKEVEQAWIDASTAREKYFSAQRYVASATEAARQVERKYDLGAATVVDYNTAIANLVKAQTQLLQAKYEYIFKTRIIRFYTHDYPK